MAQMKKLITFILVVVSHLGFSQILKVDKGSLLLDSTKILIGNLGLNFNVNNRSTTVETPATFVGLTGTSDVVYLSDKHAYIIITSINYFKSTGGPLISTGYAHGRVNLLRKNKLSYELYTQIQYDDGRNMPFRLLGGGGIRVNVLETKKSSVHFGMGIMREHENWKAIQLDNSIIEKRIWKTSDYLGINTVFNEIVSLHLIAYYQGGWDEDAKVFRNRVSGDFQFQVKVTDKLSFLTNFTAQYEDKPIIPINNFVYSLTNGLAWKF